MRRTLGIGAFGINAYTANAGELVVEEHDETGAGAGHHEELYVVVTGRATFTVDGESFDAPIGTMVFLPDNPSLLYDLACLEALQGNADDALEHLRTAFEQQPRFKEYAAKDPDLDSLRDDPRFADLT